MSWDTRLDKATFYAGVTIHKRVPTEEDMEIKVFGGGEVLKAVYRGRYEDVISAYKDLKKYADEIGFSVSTKNIEVFSKETRGTSPQEEITIYIPVTRNVR